MDGLTLGALGRAGVCWASLHWGHRAQSSPEVATAAGAEMRLLLEKLAWCGNFQWENQMCHAGEKGRDSKLVSLLDVGNNISREGLALSCEIKM